MSSDRVALSRRSVPDRRNRARTRSADAALQSRVIGTFVARRALRSQPNKDKAPVARTSLPAHRRRAREMTRGRSSKRTGRSARALDSWTRIGVAKSCFRLRGVPMLQPASNSKLRRCEQRTSHRNRRETEGRRSVMHVRKKIQRSFRCRPGANTKMGNFTVFPDGAASYAAGGVERAGAV